ncbi:hypothetical protein [Kibdelosporangium phytohabitans]|nr:hypothetical protein [Kibdelosporangium phytohabitans]MBE1470256.1 putative DsbA family dithiol-disulfide isomerase [Kibdelosporangium phytohabitans]
MYENQALWAEQTVPQRAVFKDYATRIGLDVPKFGAALDDPAVAQRVARN